MTLVQKLEKPLTILGAVIVIGTLIASYSALQTLNAKVAQKEQDKIELDDQVKELNNEIDLLKNAPLDKLLEMNLIKVGGRVVKLEGRKDQHGNQLFTFNYWLDVPNNRKQDIKTVKYVRIGGPVAKKVLQSSEPSNGFVVSYAGWGCFTKVDVTIVETTDREINTSFDGCQFWEMRSDQ